MKLEVEKNYVALAADGTSRVVAGGEQFWSLPEAEIDAFGRDLLICEFVSEGDWPSWEMHPKGDEFVYLVSGAADFLIELDNEVQRIPLEVGQAVLVPRGRWHTAKVFETSRMLFITRGEGTQHRAVTSA